MQGQWLSSMAGMQAQYTGTIYRHTIQAQYTGTLKRHTVQAHFTGTLKRHTVQAHYTGTLHMQTTVVDHSGTPYVWPTTLGQHILLCYQLRNLLNKSGRRPAAVRWGISVVNCAGDQLHCLPAWFTPVYQTDRTGINPCHFLSPTALSATLPVPTISRAQLSGSHPKEQTATCVGNFWSSYSLTSGIEWAPAFIAGNN